MPTTTLHYAYCLVGVAYHIHLHSKPALVLLLVRYDIFHMLTTAALGFC